MDQLAPDHVPVYAGDDERRTLWQDCADRGRPVVAIREATRGYIVRYDLQGVDAELSSSAVKRVRERARSFRTYPTAADGGETAGADPLSESEGVGGEAGPVSGDLHAERERTARELASRLSAVVFDRSNWRRA